MAAFSIRHPFFSSLQGPLLAIAFLLLAGWIAWTALIATLIVVPAVAVIALIARLSRRHAPATPGVTVIDGEYRVL